MTKVGWELVAWTGEPVKCNVPTCEAAVNSGHVRVDHPRPQDGDPVLCWRCWWLISAGLDPDPGAAVPEWEQANRDERLREAMSDGPG